MNVERKRLKTKALFDIPDYFNSEPDKNEGIIETPANWEGHSYCVPIGRVYNATGIVESFVIEDNNNGNTDIFERLKSDKNLNLHIVNRSINVVKNGSKESHNVNEYFIPYSIEGHVSTLPTVDYTSISAYNIGIKGYDFKYEVLLVAGDDFKKYITFDVKSDGYLPTCLYEELRELEDNFERFFEEQTHGFRTNYGMKEVIFYNTLGKDTPLEIDSTLDLVRMVHSIRMVGLKVLR